MGMGRSVVVCFGGETVGLKMAGDRNRKPTYVRTNSDVSA